jgi:PIN domain nuclease of toxin-antitoxin system
LNYLLDTCAALWFMTDRSRFSETMLEALTDPANPVFVSDVSLLEIAIKYHLGKLTLARPPSRLLPELLAAHALLPLPLTAPAIYLLESLPLHHRDPFYRLLVAQALTVEGTLVSPDPKLRPYGAPVWWG